MAKKKVSNQQPKKAPIPKALREQVWIQNVGQQFENKCLVEWCQNKMNVFDFHVGHNIPESKGGATIITNLKPICARCNLSMGSQYSIEEWTKMGLTFPHIKAIKVIEAIEAVTKEAIPKKPWWVCC